MYDRIHTMMHSRAEHTFSLLAHKHIQNTRLHNQLTLSLPLTAADWFLMTLSHNRFNLFWGQTGPMYHTQLH